MFISSWLHVLPSMISRNSQQIEAIDKRWIPVLPGGPYAAVGSVTFRRFCLQPDSLCRHCYVEIKHMLWHLQTVPLTQMLSHMNCAQATHSG